MELDHTHEERDTDNFLTIDGHPLWMALLTKEEAVTLPEDHVLNAKIKLGNLMEFHHGAVESCRNKTLEESREVLADIEDSDVDVL
jgi:hypothetical protein